MLSSKKRSFYITSPQGVEHVKELFKTLPEWSYTEETNEGIDQEYLKHNLSEIQIYVRTGFKDNSYMTSNVMPQDMANDLPKKFEDDDLFKLYQSVQKIIANNEEFSKIVVSDVKIL